MSFDFLKNIDFLLIQVPVILLSLTVHEYFHGWTANKLGDPTAKLQGRLTLRPIPPLDGSRVLYGLLPDKYAYAYSRFEPYGVLVLFGVFIFAGGIFRYLLYPVSYLTVALSGYNVANLWDIIGTLLK
jgi:Zn-dependent protease